MHAILGMLNARAATRDLEIPCSGQSAYIVRTRRSLNYFIDMSTPNPLRSSRMHFDTLRLSWQS